MFNTETTRVSWFSPPVSPVKDSEGKIITKANQTPNGTLTLLNVYQWIIGEGKNNRLKGQTESLRNISDPDPKKAHDLRGEYKKQNLPFITFGGSFSYRKIDKLMTSSNLVCLDIDGQDQTPNLTPDDIPSLRERLSQDTELDPVLIFRSPSGDGLKVVVNIRQEIVGDPEFKQAYLSLENYLKTRYNIISDPARKDIAGACFLCYDPEAIFRSSGAGFDVGKWKPVEAPKPVPVCQFPLDPLYRGTEPSDLERATIAVEDIESSGIDITTDRNEWRNIGFALSTLGEAGRGLFHRVSQYYPKYDRRDTDSQFDSFIRSKGGGICLETLFYIANKYGVKMRSSNVYSQAYQPQQIPASQAPILRPQRDSQEYIERRRAEFRDKALRLLKPTTERDVIARESNLPEALVTGYQVISDDNLRMKMTLPSGKLIAIAGPSGHGKTLFLMNLLLNVAKRYPEKRFVLFTYEENSDTILEYLLNIYLNDLNLMNGGDWRSNRVLIKEYFTGHQAEHINPLSVPEFNIRKERFFRQYIENGKILINYIDSSSTELCQFIEFLSAPENNIGGVFVDYFQCINPDEEKRFPSRQEALKSICFELKDVANKTGLPVTLACQFNQEVCSPTDVLLNKIGEAGDISRIVSECWGLWQMGKDISRSLSGKEQAKVERLEEMSQNIKLRDPFQKGMYLRSLKSRLVETGSEIMLDFRGLTGKITPNDPDEEQTIKVDDWEKPDPTLGMKEDDLPM